MRAEHEEGDTAFPIHLTGIGRITLSDARGFLESLPEAIRKAETADLLGRACGEAKAAATEIAIAVVKHMGCHQRAKIVDTIKLCVSCNIMERLGLEAPDAGAVQIAFIEGWDDVTHPRLKKEAST